MDLYSYFEKYGLSIQEDIHCDYTRVITLKKIYEDSDKYPHIPGLSYETYSNNEGWENSPLKDILLLSSQPCALR